MPVLRERHVADGGRREVQLARQVAEQVAVQHHPKLERDSARFGRGIDSPVEAAAAAEQDSAEGRGVGGGHTVGCSVVG